MFPTFQTSWSENHWLLKCHIIFEKARFYWKKRSSLTKRTSMTYRVTLYVLTAENLVGGIPVLLVVLLVQQWVTVYLHPCCDACQMTNSKIKLLVYAAVIIFWKIFHLYKLWSHMHECMHTHKHAHTNEAHLHWFYSIPFISKPVWVIHEYATYGCM